MKIPDFKCFCMGPPIHHTFLFHFSIWLARKRLRSASIHGSSSFVCEKMINNCTSEALLNLITKHLWPNRNTLNNFLFCFFFLRFDKTVTHHPTLISNRTHPEAVQILNKLPSLAVDSPRNRGFKKQLFQNHSNSPSSYSYFLKSHQRGGVSVCGSGLPHPTYCWLLQASSPKESWKI